MITFSSAPTFMRNAFVSVPRAEVRPVGTLFPVFLRLSADSVCPHRPRLLLIQAFSPDFDTQMESLFADEIVGEVRKSVSAGSVWGCEITESPWGREESLLALRWRFLCVRVLCRRDGLFIHVTPFPPFLTLRVFLQRQTCLTVVGFFFKSVI